jgi:Na+/phosphate symporter
MINLLDISNILFFLHIASSLSLVLFGQYLLIITLRAGIPVILEHYVQKYCATTIVTFLASAVISGLFINGYITTLMAMAFVEVGLLSSSQGIVLMLGSTLGILFDIYLGTSLKVLIPPVFVIAALGYTLAFKGTSNARYGHFLFSIALMNQGILFLEIVNQPIRAGLSTGVLFHTFTTQTFLGTLTLTAIGMVTEIIVEGGSSLLSIMQELTIRGLATPEDVTSFMLGSMLGPALITISTAVILHNKPAKKVAYAYLISLIHSIFFTLLFYRSFLSLVLTITPYAPHEISAVNIVSNSYTTFIILNALVWLLLKDLLVAMVRGITRRDQQSLVSLSDLIMALPEYAREFYIECAENLEAAIRETRYVLDYLINTIQDNSSMDMKKYRRAKELLNTTLHHAENSLNALIIYSKNAPLRPKSLELFTKHLSTIDSVHGIIHNIERQLPRLGEPLSPNTSLELIQIKEAYQKALCLMFDKLHEEGISGKNQDLSLEVDDKLTLLRVMKYFSNIASIVELANDDSSRHHADRKY